MLSPKMRFDVVDVIIESGYAGCAEEYVKQFYGKTFDELTVCEAEMIIKNLKPGDLFKPVKGGNNGGETGEEGAGSGGSVGCADLL